MSASKAKPKAAENRTARSIRSLSSANRSIGRPDGADHPPGEVFLPADEVDHPALQRIEEQAVDGEVAPQGVFPRGTEGDVVGMPAVAISGVLAEGGHLDHAGLLRPPHGDHAEGGADGQRLLLAEEVADLLGPGAGGHVVILGRAMQKLIADAPAGPVGLISRLAQPAAPPRGRNGVVLPGRAGARRLAPEIPGGNCP